MSVEFKISADADEAAVRQVLEELDGRGLVADPMFPEQSRPALSRMFIIRAPGVQVEDVAQALEAFGADVEYVEGDVTRKTFDRGAGPT